MTEEMELFTLIHGKKIFKNKKGFSLVELMVAVGIGGFLTVVLMSLVDTQIKDSVDQQVIISRLDLEQPVINFINDGELCTFLLNDPSQAGNRSSDTFNASGLSDTTPFVINVKNLLVRKDAAAPAFATVGKPASLLSNKLLITNMKFSIKPNRPPDLFLADFEVEFNQPLKTRPISKIIIRDIQIATDSTTPINAKKIIGCGGLGESLAQRIMFTSNGTWTVPVGIRRVFVTMAGGGGSGVGWRVASSMTSGHSGGYIFSQPTKVKPGEVMTIIVGKGGKGYPAIRTSVFADVGPPHYIFASGADDGLGGYPGESSKLISPTMGTLLECAGGSGAAINGIDSYSGGLMAGGVTGIISTSGNPNWPSPNRIAAGPYAQLNNAGTCGAGGYGVGNRGSDKYNFTSGTIEGGPTPFGYGSGGDITAFGCYVNATTTGTCVFPDDGSDGVVYIDIW